MSTPNGYIYIIIKFAHWFFFRLSRLGGATTKTKHTCSVQSNLKEDVSSNPSVSFALVIAVTNLNYIYEYIKYAFWKKWTMQNYKV